MKKKKRITNNHVKNLKSYSYFLLIKVSQKKKKKN